MRSVLTFVDARRNDVASTNRLLARTRKFAMFTMTAMGLFSLLPSNTAAANAAVTSNNVALAAPNAVPNPVAYTIKLGDTLTALSAKFHVSINTIASLNALSNINRIVAGNQLFIPSSGSITSTNSPSGAVNAPRPVGLKTIPNTAAYNATPSPGGPLPSLLAATPSRVALRQSFSKAASTYHVPFELLESMDWNESGWQNSVVSSTGAVGIGQLMPDTVTFVNQNLVKSKLDPSNPDQNIQLSAAFLHYLLAQTHNDSRWALGAYYQGLASTQINGIYPSTTQYIQTVLAIQRVYF